MRVFLIATSVLALLAVGVVLSNLQTTETVSLRWGPWVAFQGPLPSAIVAALFVGAGVLGVPLLVSNLLLRGRVGRLERLGRTPAVPAAEPFPGGDAEPTRKL
ncbi:MAG: hypothetical protein QN172_10915 [Armatimonadota bacterium]|nr:hypothetical protein [Armatimonadota bacterium]MDR7440330.1 hypothetical protein [Armatimonadota bacterium]MDR7562765.1 hypothetical protein [Armatimonadota bacterium]MDR7568654.1 hypothetical protein [Armatimonadota bacterium]MDR7602950.1 hypothetical protein [Armatimonadota bacterium]